VDQKDRVAALEMGVGGEVAIMSGDAICKPEQGPNDDSGDVPGVTNPPPSSRCICKTDAHQNVRG